MTEAIKNAVKNEKQVHCFSPFIDILTMKELAKSLSETKSKIFVYTRGTDGFKIEKCSYCNTSKNKNKTCYCAITEECFSENQRLCSEHIVLKITESCFHFKKIIWEDAEQTIQISTSANMTKNHLQFDKEAAYNKDSISVTEIALSEKDKEMILNFKNEFTDYEWPPLQPLKDKLFHVEVKNKKRAIVKQIKHNGVFNGIDDRGDIFLIIVKFSLHLKSLKIKK